jgi:hypothetical protein
VARFPLGRVVATPGALEVLERAGVSPFDLLARHAAGDWGDLGNADRLANEMALLHDTRLLSAYTLPGGKRMWVITEWDRSVTTLLLPSEY